MEQLERQVLADRQAMIARGATEGLPSFGVECAAFDEWLISEPVSVEPLTQVDRERLEEHRALGVA